MMKIPLLLNLLTFLAVVSVARENPDKAKEEPTSENSGGRIIIEAPQDIPEPPVFYSADIDNQVTIDPSKVSYETLLDAFFHSVDPTTKDRQFVDVGNQYRTAIYYYSDEQKEAAVRE